MKKQPSAFKHEQEEFPETSSTTIVTLANSSSSYISKSSAFSLSILPLLILTSPVQYNPLHLSIISVYSPHHLFPLQRGLLLQLFLSVPHLCTQKRLLLRINFEKKKNRVEPNLLARIIPAKSELFVHRQITINFDSEKQQNVSVCVCLCLCLYLAHHTTPDSIARKLLRPSWISAFTFLIQNGHLCRQFEEGQPTQV